MHSGLGWRNEETSFSPFSFFCSEQNYLLVSNHCKFIYLFVSENSNSSVRNEQSKMVCVCFMFSVTSQVQDTWQF
jgi:hypothetical protein